MIFKIYLFYFIYQDPDTVPATVASMTNLSDTVKGLTLKVNTKEGLSFKPGQWLDFFIPGEAQVGGFSMCSSPDMLQSLGTLDLAVKVSSWPPSHWVHTQCKQGSQVSIDLSER